MYRLNLLQKDIKTKHAVITWLETIQADVGVSHIKLLLEADYATRRLGYNEL
jgi:hypothetical protein